MSPTLIRYTLSRVDLFRAQLRMLVGNRFIQVLYCGLGIFIFWSELGVAKDVSFFANIVVALLAAFALLLFAFALTVMFLLSLTFARNTGILCEHEIELKDEGLVERTEVNETLHRWAAIQKVVCARHALYIQVTDTQKHVIPRRFFKSLDEMREFKAEIEKRVAEAKRIATAEPVRS